MSQRIGQVDDGLLTAFDQVGQVVGEHVAEHDRNQRVRHQSRQLFAGCCASTPPVARAANQNVTPTTATNTSSPAVRIRRCRCGTSRCAGRRSCATPASPRSCRKPSSPSSTAEHRHGARPDRQRRQVVERIADRDASVAGCAAAERSRDATTLYTSNGSARANHRSPQTIAPVKRDHDVDQQPEPDARQRSRVGAGELQPHEREQPDRRGPVARAAADSRRRRAAATVEATGTTCAPARSRARPGRSPRMRHQADPHQHVEHAGQRVAVRPADRRTRRSPPTRRTAGPPRPPPSA